ncbi:hypothetical protein BJV74DRAFT_833905 [Russula compacta]|nr:hypothetical protein BJV74DRAFT_833905 [Russula compacta]
MSASFWLDSSDDSIFFAPSSDLFSRSSTDSFNIDDIPSLDNYPSLLLPSCSLDSLPISDLEPIKAPPCPLTTPRRQRTQHTFLSLMASLAFPKGNRPNRKYPNILVSSPTPERLRNVPQLKPVLKTWISAVPGLSPPDMAPWSPPREKLHYVWVPEGSFFPPSYLKRCLRERYGPVDPHPSSTLGTSRLAATSKPVSRPESPSGSRPLRRCASHSTRQTRVPDCTLAYTPISYPSVRARTKLRRWSLGVPPSYLGTELIIRRLESQRIDAITGTESAQSDASIDAPSLPLPAIKVSTSTTTIAISLPGSPEGPAAAPEPLAIRRGQKMPVPLTLNSPKRAPEEYPSIPTAFLGTPSAYTPHFQLTSSITQLDAESLPIGDMISALRSQAASLKVSSPAETCPSLLGIPHPSANSLSAASSDIVQSVSDDDWAFAQDLMLRYADHVRDRTPSKAKHRQQQAPSIRKSLTPRSSSATQTIRIRRASVPPVASTPNNRPKSSSAPRTDLAKPGYNTDVARQRKDLREATSNIRARKYIPQGDSRACPSLRPPSPVTPSHPRTLAPSSPNNPKSEFSIKRPLGILKRAKSVRFADMPKPDDGKENSSWDGQPRTSTPKGVAGSPPLQPSPLRACFVPEELEIQSPSRQPHAAPATEESTRVFMVNRRDSVQPTPSQNVNLCGSVFNSPTLSATPGLSDKSPSSSNSRAVKTLSLLVREHDKDKGKENSPLALRTQRRTRRHTEVDENTARRASECEGRSRKHRLSSPLKSFLDRLRA